MDIYKQLNQESKGWTIEKWQEQPTGEPFRLILAKGEQKKVLIVSPTDLSATLDEIRIIDSDGREKYNDLKQMSDEIIGHLATMHNIRSPDNILEVIELEHDVFQLLFGFTCKKCQKEWWISLKSVAMCPDERLRKAMQNPETRPLIASENYAYGIHKEDIEDKILGIYTNLTEEEKENLPNKV